MKKFLVWSAATILLAALFHVAGVWFLPRFITRIAVNRVNQVAGLTGPNQMFYGQVHSAGEDGIVLDNPDSVFSFAAYDISEKPVRIRCIVPETNNYWSISFYASNTDNFYVVNDRTAKAKQFDLVLVKADGKYQKTGNEEIVIAPDKKGVMLVRMIVNDRHNQAELARLAELQKQTIIEEIDNAAY